jgi:hypothetical protein
MGKMVVLKPVVWSPNGYRFPAGIEKSGDDYVATQGFGHEEWNGEPGRLWKGQRVFHTEAKGRMKEYGRRGDLGIIMTAYAPSGPHAVGVATSVRLNAESEGISIAKAVGAKAYASEMWKLPSVKKRYKGFPAFKAFWEQSCNWIAWRCPPEQYEWFTTPVRLNPGALFPPTPTAPKSPEIIKMYSAYMAVTQEQALSVVWNSLDEASSIVEWLRTGTFDDLPVKTKTKSYGKPRPSGGPMQHGSAPPAQEPYVRYILAQEVTVSPKHKEVQDRFAAHVAANGASAINPDRAGVDIQFELAGRGLVLAEVKPCGRSDARFAVRTAMGQLLDYQQRHPARRTHLLVVLKVKPYTEDIELAIKNGFGIAYPWGAGFVLKWPS